MKKKLISLLVMLAMLIACFSQIVVASSTQTFRDVPTNNWAYESIEKMYHQGIVKGYPDGTFKPSQSVKYGEFIKMAVVAVTGRDPGSADTSKTGGATHWASLYYKEALDSGFFSSTQIRESVLDLEIPRADMALIAANAVRAEAVKDYDGVLAALSDIENNDYQYQIMQSYEAGIISGYPEGLFRPNGKLTRAETSAVINRLTDKSARVVTEKKEEPKDKAQEDIKDTPKANPDEVFTDGLGMEYKMVKLTDYVPNYATECNKMHGEVVLHWTEEARLYSEAPEIEEIYRTWEQGAEFFKKNPTKVPGPYASFLIETESCMEVYMIKDKKVIEKVESNSRADHDAVDIRTYVEPSVPDYYVLVGASGKHGKPVRIYPNPFK